MKISEKMGMHTSRCTRRDRAFIFTGVLLVLGIATWRTMSILPMRPFNKLLDFTFENFSIVEVAEFNTSMAKLTVIDIATRDPFNRINIRRRMLNMDRNEIFVSEVELIPPEVLPSTPFNTSLLAVDHSKINVASRPLVAPPFATGSLSLQRDASSDVLIIGLGGSQMNNYLHYTFPNMRLTVIELESTMREIALKYFGLIEDKNQKVIVMDGQDYLQHTASAGTKFDAIYIDACPTKFPFEEAVLCPIHIFLNKTNIENMKKSLKPKGTLAVKTLIFSRNVTLSAEKIADHYRQYFKHCTVMPMISELNRVIVCGGDEVSGESMDFYTMLNNKSKFYNEFRINEDYITASQ